MVTEPEEETTEETTEKEGAEEITAEAPEPPARPRKRGRYGSRRKVCPICSEGLKIIDYKDIGFLRRFVSDRGRIEPRRKLASCAKHQRALAVAIKRARHLALLPYTSEHIRKMGAFPPR